MGSTKGTSLHKVVRRTDRRNHSNGCRDIAIFRLFQDGGRPPSWTCGICGMPIWTTHKECSVVFIVLPNLVVTDKVVFIIHTFSYFTSLVWKVFLFYYFGLKMPIHAPKMRFWGILTPKWEAVTTLFTKGISLHRNTSYDVKIVEIGQMAAEI